MMNNLKTILIAVAIFIITSLLGWIGWNTRDVPQIKEMFENVKTQLDRHDELIDQEILKAAIDREKIRELEKRITKLEK